MKQIRGAINKKKGLENQLKQLFLACHRYAGFLAGFIFFAVCLSGSILIFEDELTPLLYAHEQVVEVGSHRMATDNLVAKAKAVFPQQQLFRMEISSDKDRSVKFLYGTKKIGYQYAFLNPYTGEVLSKGLWNNRFFPIVLNFHRFLLAGPIGKTITGLSCLFILFISLSGIYLWWPSSKRVLKQRLKIKTDAKRKRLIWDIHAVGGFYVCIVLLLITLTGLVWSYTWVNKQLFMLLDGELASKEQVIPPTEEVATNATPYETIIQAVEADLPAAGDMILTFPTKKTPAVLVTKRQGDIWPTRDRIYYDSRSGALLSAQKFADQSRGTQVRQMIKPLHTGAWLGLSSKLIYFIAMLFAASLPITGFLIWQGKRKKKPLQKKSTNVPQKATFRRKPVLIAD